MEPNEEVGFLSLDLGPCNLGRVEGSSTETKLVIKVWDRLYICPSTYTIERTRVALVKHFRKVYPAFPEGVYYVVIEQQVRKNPKCQMMCYTLAMYFIMLLVAQGCERPEERVIIISARKKNLFADRFTTSVPVLDLSKCKTRVQIQKAKQRRSKKVAVEVAKILIQEMPEAQILFSEAHPKQDDLADSLLQWMAFYEEVLLGHELGPLSAESEKTQASTDISETLSVKSKKRKSSSIKDLPDCATDKPSDRKNDNEYGARDNPRNTKKQKLTTRRKKDEAQHGQKSQAAHVVQDPARIVR